MVLKAEEDERMRAEEAKDRALAYDKARTMKEALKRTPGDPFSFTEGLDSADQSLPPIGGGSSLGGLPAIG